MSTMIRRVVTLLTIVAASAGVLACGDDGPNRHGHGDGQSERGGDTYVDCSVSYTTSTGAGGGISQPLPATVPGNPQCIAPDTDASPSCALACDSRTIPPHVTCEVTATNRHANGCRM